MAARLSSVLVTDTKGDEWLKYDATNWRWITELSAERNVIEHNHTSGETWQWVRSHIGGWVGF